MASLCLSLAVAAVVCSTSLGIKPNETIAEYLAKYGIEAEEHFVDTDDGYILGAFRMPHPGAPVVLFQHGILSSAWCWIDNDPLIAPAFQVYNMGYDVWLTNSRGNTYSLAHKTLHPRFSKTFWNFSFADMARHDVPSNVDYILRVTGKSSLSFVAHSQGTTQFLAAMTDAAMKTKLEEKVNLFVALAPVAYLSHQSSILIHALTKYQLGDVLQKLWPFGFLTWDSLSTVADWFCKVTFGVVCKTGVDLVCGHSVEDTAAAITNISAHFPAGTSVKSLVHFQQLSNHAGKFQDYDYGERENLLIYGSASPPSFNLSQAAHIPTAFFIGERDDLGDPVDAAFAISQLPASTVKYQRLYPDYSHITWIAGTWAAFQAWFPDFQELLRTHNPIAHSADVNSRSTEQFV
eukprot:TRINITY_DN91184_c0_g1_i1.p1 TRINITY_DN91184_c0_g1~~TRINITY_DN91184_c0_g1_i1.p1  ORF type:complete len:418 (+),score=48.33 TRINITY_DN91184_c0_g1_i1:40-1254(+)